MDLTVPLKELVARVPGAMGAILVDDDGEAVTYFSVQPQLDERTTPQERIRLIGAYQYIWLSDCRRIINELREGRLNHLVQTYQFGRVMARPLRHDYALFLVGRSSMPLSLGMRCLDEASELIESDL